MVNRKVEYITTKELMKLAGIASRDTVRAYEKAGLISPDTPPDRPRTKGPAKFWKRECVQVCVWIKSMRRDKLDYDQIRKELRRKEKREQKGAGTKNNKSDASSAGRNRKIASSCPRAMSTLETAYREAKRLARFVRDTKTSELVAEVHWNKALKIAKSGQRPFLVITETQIEVHAESSLQRLILTLSSASQIVPLASHFENEMMSARSRRQDSDGQRLVDLQ